MDPNLIEKEDLEEEITAITTNVEVSTNIEGSALTDVIRLTQQ